MSNRRSGRSGYEAGEARPILGYTLLRKKPILFSELKTGWDNKHGPVKIRKPAERKYVNTIDILAPRWHDRVVLIADHRIRDDNLIVIHHKDYPSPLYMSGAWSKQFPIEQLRTRRGGKMPVRAVPLDELLKERLAI